MQPLPADGQWIGLIAQAVHTGMNTCAGTNHDAAAATPPASRQVLPRIDLAWQLRDGRLQPLEHTTATAAGDAIATATARLRACLIEAFADLDLTSLGPEPRELRVRLHASAP
ncbi:hypothetical protein [Haliangium sp.]|uniref:hypothetical protein n=1 Tax=Haliangium sp. TaxID=2663208 RepID=UPI003D13DFA9